MDDQEVTEQPKDYESYEEFLNSGYEDLNLFGRITYTLQDHVWKVIFITALAGYLIGIRFGVFW